MKYALSSCICMICLSIELTQTVTWRVSIYLTSLHVASEPEQLLCSSVRMLCRVQKWQPCVFQQRALWPIIDRSAHLMHCKMYHCYAKGALRRIYICIVEEAIASRTNSYFNSGLGYQKARHVVRPYMGPILQWFLQAHVCYILVSTR